MKRGVLVIVIAIVVSAAALAVILPMLGFGFASLSQTDNTGNSMSTEYYVMAEMRDDVGNEIMVQSPSVVYRLEGETYVPDYKILYTKNGTLHVKTPVDNDVPIAMNLRVLTEFKNALSWSLIERLDLNLNGRVYNLYDATSDIRDGIAGDSSERIPVVTGSYTFNISAQFKSSVKMDPTDFHASKMESNVAFVLNKLDPIDAKVKTIEFVKGEGAAGTMADQVLDQSRPYLNRCTFTKDGWSFAYWSDVSSNQYGDEGNVYGLIDGESSKATLTANWGKSVSFYPYGGSGVMHDQVIYTGSLQLNKNSFVRTGYVFQGWSTTPGGVKVYDDEDSLSLEIDNGMKLYAVWETIKLTVTFKSQTGQDDKSQIITVEGKNLKTIDQLGFSKSGFVFLGWNESSVGAPVISDGADMSDSIGDADSSETLYAIWGKRVRFNANGGSGSMPMQELYDGSNRLREEAFVDKPGYAFEKWNTNSDGSGASYTDKEVIDLASFVDNTVLYAIWILIPVDVESVSVSPTSDTITVGQTIQLSATVLPDNATDKRVSWTSSDDSKATVTADGEVTGVSAGEVTITVTTTDGSKTATCTITVT